MGAGPTSPHGHCGVAARGYSRDAQTLSIFEDHVERRCSTASPSRLRAMDTASPSPTLNFAPVGNHGERSGVGGAIACDDVDSGFSTAAKLKASTEWQTALWRRWPRDECWPAEMDVYEAAAYLRVSPDTIRRALVVARDGRARLAHQRLGSIYRIRKSDLDMFGVIPGRHGRG